MLEETGRVVAVDDQVVWISSSRTSSCMSCSASKGCGQKALAEYASRKSEDLRVENLAGVDVRVGDQVIIGIREGSFLKASLLLYTLPLLLLFVGGYLGTLQGDSELPAILGSAVGLAVGLLVARILGQRLGRDCQYQPILLKVIPQSS
ncbi:MAG: SoxR reducing system RseC family protein [Oceanospirillaceae bacterium]|nr:SoxR reducing system RseC family protein [Oceanospirillaceae bacterium]